MTPRQTAEKTTRPPSSGRAPAAKAAKKRASAAVNGESAPPPDAPPPDASASKRTPTSKSAPASTKGRGSKKTPTATAPEKPASFRGIAVPADDDPWTRSEVLAVEAQLRVDIERLNGEITAAKSHLDQLQVGAGGSSGEDPVDSGAKAYERETELSIIGNARQMITLCEDALARLADGRYGTCDACEGPIRKLRLQAFPRASQCLACKRRAERH
jgi:RNA polymerase-binding transcription factor DksA